VSYGISSLVSGQKRSIPHAILRLLQTPLLTPIGLAMANQGIYGLNMLKFFDTEPGMSLLMRAIDGVLEGFQSGLFQGWWSGNLFPGPTPGMPMPFCRQEKIEEK